MKKTVLKFWAIWQFEEEKQWINKMSNSGWNLVKVSLCCYTFEKGTPGEYTYSLELLNTLSSPESQSYINFMGENGVEKIGQFKSWVYFRSKSSEGKTNPEPKPISILDNLISVENKLVRALYMFNWAILFTFIYLTFSEEININLELSYFLRGFSIGLSFSLLVTGLCLHYYIKNLSKKIKSIVKDLNSQIV